MKEVILPVKSVRNPRDMGGLIGFNNRKVKLHRLLRTGTISQITQEDADFFKNYGLVQVIDLRSPCECVKKPDREIDGVKHINIPVNNVDQTQAGFSLAELQEKYHSDYLAGFKHMIKTYRRMIVNPDSQKAFHKILKLLADTPKGATIFHCSEGKDRTGLTAFFILYVLGVDLETIRQDYLFSAEMLNDYRAKRDKESEQRGGSFRFRANLRSLGTVNNEYFDTALITMEEEFGGIDQYIEKQLGVDNELCGKLRSLYLE